MGAIDDTLPFAPVRVIARRLFFNEIEGDDRLDSGDSNSIQVFTYDCEVASLRADKSSCLFCNIESLSEHTVVLQNELALFIRSEKFQGALKHSGLIVPVTHRETVFDLTAEEVRATFELLHEVKSYMDREFRPGGYNLGWNCGEVAGQHVFHAHMHVMPRFREEPLAGAGIRTYLKSSANAW